tara:strand:+ start:896 stop:1051 length:156 start_codon:yes stop_codon:yes gene_type:complete
MTDNTISEIELLAKRMKACLDAKNRGTSKWAKSFWKGRMKEIYSNYMGEQL